MTTHPNLEAIEVRVGRIKATLGGKNDATDCQPQTTPNYSAGRSLIHFHFGASVAIHFFCARRVFIALCFVALAAVLPAPAKSADWDHWRGPARNGIAAEPSGWDGETWLQGELWRASVGEGSSSPLVVGNEVYLTGWSGNRDTLHCLDAGSGEVMWRQSYKSPRYGRAAVGDQFLYSGACSTPEYDSQTGLLFTLSADGDLIAWDTNKKGERVWGLNLYERYQAPRRPEVAKRKKTQRDYGYTTSPLAVNGQLIVEVGGKSGNLVAFDMRDGRELWQPREGL